MFSIFKTGDQFYAECNIHANMQNTRIFWLKAICILNMNFFQVCYTSSPFWTTWVWQRLLGLNIGVFLFSWHTVAFSRSPPLPCSGYGHVTEFWPMGYEQKRRVLHPVPPMLGLPSLSVWTWMDWALRKVEPAEGRAWVLEWLCGESPLLTRTGLFYTRSRPGVQPLKAGIALCLLWLVQQGLTNQSNTKHSLNVVYLSQMYISPTYSWKWMRKIIFTF